MSRGDNTRFGELLIDNRVAAPLPGMATFFEGAVALCKHCQRGIIKNPFRERPRAHCFSCHHDICDECAVAARIHGCKPFDQVIEEYLREASNLKVV